MTDAGGDQHAEPDIAVDSWDRPRSAWLLSGTARDPRRRVLLLELTTRILFPTILTFALYLLLAGHSAPGGGFAAGLVGGLAFVLRYLAGGGEEIGALLRVRPPVVVATGLTVALVTALVPVAFGAPALSTAVLTVDLPGMGHLELPSSLLLDLGVFLLVVGVVLDLLRTLGEGLEQEATTQETDREEPM